MDHCLVCWHLMGKCQHLWCAIVLQFDTVWVHTILLHLRYLLCDVCKRRYWIPVFIPCLDAAKCNCRGCQWSQIYWDNEGHFSWCWPWEHILWWGSANNSIQSKVPMTWWSAVYVTCVACDLHWALYCLKELVSVVKISVGLLRPTQPPTLSGTGNE